MLTSQKWWYRGQKDFEFPKLDLIKSLSDTWAVDNQCDRQLKLLYAEKACFCNDLKKGNNMSDKV